MKYVLLTLTFALSILGACTSEKTEVNRAELEQQVLAVHDSAMAKMGDIYKLRKNLLSLRDSLEAQTQTDSIVLNKLQLHIQSLNQADESMMAWMRQYKAPAENQENEQAINYLQHELVKVQKLQTLMDSTINAARSTYRSNE